MRSKMKKNYTKTIAWPVGLITNSTAIEKKFLSIPFYKIKTGNLDFTWKTLTTWGVRKCISNDKMRKNRLFHWHLFFRGLFWAYFKKQRFLTWFYSEEAEEGSEWASPKWATLACGFFELKTIKPQKTQEELLTSPWAAYTNLERGAWPETELPPKATLFWITYLYGRANI